MEEQKTKEQLKEKFEKVAKKMSKITGTDTYIETMGMYFDNDLKIMIETVCRKMKLKVRFYENNSKYRLAVYTFRDNQSPKNNHTTTYRKSQIEELDKSLKQAMDMAKYYLEYDN